MTTSLPTVETPIVCQEANPRVAGIDRGGLSGVVCEPGGHKALIEPSPRLKSPSYQSSSSDNCRTPPSYRFRRSSRRNTRVLSSSCASSCDATYASVRSGGHPTTGPQLDASGLGHQHVIRLRVDTGKTHRFPAHRHTAGLGTEAVFYGKSYTAVVLGHHGRMRQCPPPSRYPPICVSAPPVRSPR